MPQSILLYVLASRSRSCSNFHLIRFSLSLRFLFSLLLRVKLQCSETTSERISTHASFCTRNKEKKQNHSSDASERIQGDSEQVMQNSSNLPYNSFSLSLSFFSLSLFLPFSFLPFLNYKLKETKIRNNILSRLKISFLLLFYS